MVPILLQSEDGEEAEETSREFLETLETPLHNGELKVSGEWNQLALCEEMLTQAMELLEPTTASGKVRVAAYSTSRQHPLVSQRCNPQQAPFFPQLLGITSA